MSQRDGIIKCDCERLTAIRKCPLSRPDIERTTGFEPATLTLARRRICSAKTAALH